MFRVNSSHCLASQTAGVFVLLVVAAVAFAPDCAVGVVIGPWDFADAAFADNATRLDSGLVKSVDEQLVVDDAGLDAVLTGFTPTSGLANIGSQGFANHFQLDFVDLIAFNGAGPDIVFFDARFSPDRYEIAVRPFGSDFTAFRTFETDDFIDTGLAGPIHPPGDNPFRFSTLFGLPIELDDYGLDSNVTVNAIQFRSLLFDALSTNPQGDPVMAAVLNAVPEPTTFIIWSLLGLTTTGACWWRRRRKT